MLILVWYAMLWYAMLWYGMVWYDINMVQECNNIYSITSRQTENIDSNLHYWPGLDIDTNLIYCNSIHNL